MTCLARQGSRVLGGWSATLPQSDRGRVARHSSAIRRSEPHLRVARTRETPAHTRRELAGARAEVIAERRTGMAPLNTLQIRFGWRSGGTFPGPVDGLNVLPRGHAEGSLEQCAEGCRIIIFKIGCCLSY